MSTDVFRYYLNILFILITVLIIVIQISLFFGYFLLISKDNLIMKCINGSNYT